LAGNSAWRSDSNSHEFPDDIERRFLEFSLLFRRRLAARPSYQQTALFGVDQQSALWPY